MKLSENLSQICTQNCKYLLNCTQQDADLHTLDMSHNELTYLYPKSFAYHASLRKVDFSHNKFSFFPTQVCFQFCS